MKFKKLAVLALGLGATLSLAACGGEQGGSSSQPTTPSTTTTTTPSTPTATSTTTTKKYSDTVEYLTNYLIEGAKESTKTDKFAFDINLDLDLGATVNENKYVFSLQDNNELLLDLNGAKSNEKILDKMTATLDSKIKISDKSKDTPLELCNLDLKAYYKDNMVYLDKSLFGGNGLGIGFKELVTANTENYVNIGAQVVSFIYSLNMYNASPDVTQALIASFKDQIALYVDSLEVTKAETDNEVVLSVDLAKVISMFVLGNTSFNGISGKAEIKLAKTGHKVLGINLELNKLELSSIIPSISILGFNIDLSKFNPTVESLKLSISPKEAKAVTLPADSELNEYKKLELSSPKELVNKFNSLVDIFKNAFAAYFPETPFGCELEYKFNYLGKNAETGQDEVKEAVTNLKVDGLLAFKQKQAETEYNTVFINVDFIFTGSNKIFGDALKYNATDEAINGKISLKLYIENYKLYLKAETTGLDDTLNESALKALNGVFIIDFEDKNNVIKNDVAKLFELIGLNIFSEETEEINLTTEAEDPNTIYLSAVFAKLLDLINYTEEDIEGGKVYKFNLDSAKVNALFTALKLNFQIPNDLALKFDLTVDTNGKAKAIDFDAKALANALFPNVIKNLVSIEKLNAHVGFNQTVSATKFEYVESEGEDNQVKMHFILADEYVRVRDDIKNLITKVITNADILGTITSAMTEKQGAYDVNFNLKMSGKEYEVKGAVSYDLTTETLVDISLDIKETKNDATNVMVLNAKFQDGKLYAKIEKQGTEEVTYVLEPSYFGFTADEFKEVGMALLKKIVAKLLPAFTKEEAIVTEPLPAEEEGQTPASVDNRFDLAKLPNIIDAYTKLINRVDSIHNLITLFENVAKVTKTEAEGVNNYKIEVSASNLIMIYASILGGNKPDVSNIDTQFAQMGCLVIDVKAEGGKITEVNVALDDTLKALASFMGINVSCSIKTKEFSAITKLTDEQKALYTNKLFSFLLQDNANDAAEQIVLEQ